MSWWNSFNGRNGSPSPAARRVARRNCCRFERCRVRCFRAVPSYASESDVDDDDEGGVGFLGGLGGGRSCGVLLFLHNGAQTNGVMSWVHLLYKVLQKSKHSAMFMTRLCTIHTTHTRTDQRIRNVYVPSYTIVL